jgi:hypothetical protein
MLTRKILYARADIDLVAEPVQFMAEDVAGHDPSGPRSTAAA